MALLSGGPALPALPWIDVHRYPAPVRDWLSTHERWLPWIQALALATFVGSLVVLPWMVGRIPADYFAGPRPPPSRLRLQHPALRATIWVLRNVLGALLVLAGGAMLVLPGQGLLTIAMGLLTADFPGKRRLELWAVARPGILASLNWLRARGGHEPLVAPRDQRDPPAA